MANKNNFVKLRLIRTFTMTNLAMLLTRYVCECVCVYSMFARVWDSAWVGVHEYVFLEHVLDSYIALVWCVQKGRQLIYGLEEFVACAQPTVCMLCLCFHSVRGRVRAVVYVWRMCQSIMIALYTPTHHLNS